jgi:hypothetical protein
MQTSLNFPKVKKAKRMVVKLDENDIAALKRGMDDVGESNTSSFIRRLIHEKRKTL